MYSGPESKGEAMGVKKSEPGFYGDDTRLCYIAPTGRVWLLCDEDGPDGVREVGGLPYSLEFYEDFESSDEGKNYLRQVEASSGGVAAGGPPPSGWLSRPALF
jgi:hypothetical protein